MINRERVVEEFLELVKIDSPSGHEREIARVLKRKLTDLGFEVYEDNAGGQVGASAGNLIAALPGSGKGPVLFLCAHMDTVEPGRNINPVIKDGVITSQGETVLGADDKAGIAAILEAVRTIKENNIEHGGLEVIFTIWEEGGLKGSKALDYSKIKAKMGYVLDSDGEPGTIIITAPAQNSIVATIKGKAAHAGQCPEDGINAIQVASRAIAKMKLGRIDEETTANIGIIRGGKATNIVPDNIYLEGEARSLSLEKLEAQTKHMCQVLQQEAEAAGAEIKIDVEKQYHTINLSADDRVVQLAVEAAETLGLKPVLTGTGGGSDANIFNGKGFACANLGIAMNKVHTTEESIKVEDLCKMAEYVTEIVKAANK
ncbi:tripeptide aminopeptidase [Desulfohalotomaculum tongense]|uniref:M20/M25/M40 family metallo-hydrolase n=1 Tax=Desulforadius tongensis TaxID=1216062 RepID=UPI001958D10D|nr:M20/M25/M40 family metallo-hydrolase [Desulforadius tongensis]MBM7854705.1 tripeptide aminopeptidase [Desulforadius tongensis]